MLLPVAASDRVDRRLAIDGRLGDWTMADAIQDGPMIRMIDRPALQRQQLDFASDPAQVFTAWADENFYVAFKLTGITPNPGFGQNFVTTQFRRAWGEDLCQLLIQPVYPDNTLGPVLHCVCKPNGVAWVERKQPPQPTSPDSSAIQAPPDPASPDGYQPFEGSGIRYAATTDPSFWRGEVAIPWSALLDSQHGRPQLLRFNFVQHQTRTGESASWAGPIDYGKDQSLMGLIYLRGN
jgi:hypothetical protein